MKINGSAFHKSLHLDDDKLDPPDPACPFCGSRNRQPVYILQENPMVLLLKCTICNAASASRMPTNDALKEYYSSYYKSPMHSNSRENVTVDDSQHFGKHMVDTILKYPTSANISILDFGGGDGSLSYNVAVQLIKNGVNSINITIIDYDDKTVLSHNHYITINKLSVLEDSRSRYNIIIASAILEHLSRSKEILSGLLSRLENGGILYARTPYVVPIMKICSLLGVKWDFTFPAHIHDLGQDFWEKYFKENRSIGEYQIVKSKPSMVETTLKKHFLRTIAAYFLKAPWYLLGPCYKWVGGWEVFIRKNPDKDFGLKP